MLIANTKQFSKSFTLTSILERENQDKKSLIKTCLSVLLKVTKTVH